MLKLIIGASIGICLLCSFGLALPGNGLNLDEEPIGLVDRVGQIEKDLTWTPFSQDLREIVPNKSDVPGMLEKAQYEYAVFRNGGFRKINTSTWNGGWRVFTEPYMGGDVHESEDSTNTKFSIVRSFWYWQTRSKLDDICDTGGDFNGKPVDKGAVMHSYYSEGDAKAIRGNGPLNPGRMWVFKRLRPIETLPTTGE